MATAVFRKSAEDDLRNIYLFIADYNPQRARSFVIEITEACNEYAGFSGAGVDKSELMENLRSFAFHKYVIFYMPVENGIEVLRILHGSRDIKAHF